MSKGTETVTLSKPAFNKTVSARCVVIP
ncbi:hypothetical protein BCU66_015100 [Vibrio sp. 10N.286.49.B1]